MQRREQNVLNTALAQALASLDEAKQRHSNARVVNGTARREQSQQCIRMSKMRAVATRCASAMEQCKRRQDGIAHLIRKRNRLRAELSALSGSQRRLQRLEEALRDDSDNEWEGVYSGSGRYAQYSVRATDEGGAVRLESMRQGGPEARIGTGGSTAIGLVGQAFRFCLDAGNPETCGRARVDAGGLEFEGVRFSRS